MAAFGEIPSNIHRLTQQPPVTCVPVNVAPTSTHHLLVQLPVHLLVHLLVQLLVHLLVQEERVNFIKKASTLNAGQGAHFFSISKISRPTFVAILESFRVAENNFCNNTYLRYCTAVLK